MPAHRKRFCLRGHDTWVVGRTPNHQCRQCEVDRAKTTRERDPEPGRAAARKYYASHREKSLDAQRVYRNTAAGMLAKVRATAKQRGSR